MSKPRTAALMMEAASTSETSVNLYQTTRRNNPDEAIFILAAWEPEISEENVAEATHFRAVMLVSFRLRNAEHGPISGRLCLFPNSAPREPSGFRVYERTRQHEKLWDQISVIKLC
jgi:hypothetical protein